MIRRMCDDRRKLDHLLSAAKCGHPGAHPQRETDCQRHPQRGSRTSGHHPLPGVQPSHETLLKIGRGGQLREGAEHLYAVTDYSIVPRAGITAPHVRLEPPLLIGRQQAVAIVGIVVEEPSAFHQRKRYGIEEMSAAQPPNMLLLPEWWVGVPGGEGSGDAALRREAVR